MATTKTVTVVHNDVTLTAAAGDTTSSSVNLLDGYGAMAHIELTNGGTGPTIAAQTQIEVSPDDTNWYEYGGPLIGTTGNSEVSFWNVPLDKGIAYVRFVSGSNTGQDVTLRVEVTEVSAVNV